MRRPSPRRILRAAARVRPADVWTGAITLALAPFVELGLRLAGVTRTARFLRVRLLLDAPAGVVATSEAELPLAPRERRRVRIAWRLMTIGPFDDTCLRRSLVGAWHLRTRDHAVRIGVRRTADGVKAHAWIEVDGVSLDREAGEFAAQWQAIGAAS